MNKFLAMGMFMLSNTNASACSFPVLPLDQQVHKAEQIFIATLLEARVMPEDRLHQWPWIEGRFHVSTDLKGGPQPSDLVLATGLGHGDCGIAMMVPAKYIIFKGKEDTRIGESTGTHLIEDFQENGLAQKIKSILRHQQFGAAKK